MTGASKIMVLGPTGGGKTTSMRNLDPKTTGIISPDRKESQIEGWEENYKTVLSPNGLPDWNKSNFITTGMPSTVIAALAAWEARPDIQTIAIDTLTHLITADYVENAIGKDYAGYQKMGKNFYMIMDMMLDSKKNIIVYAHSTIDFNEMGDRVIRMASQGKMVEAFVPPSFFTTVLITHMEMKDKKPHYYFRCQPTSNNDPVKSPVRFKGEEATNVLNFLENNDIQAILDKLSAFRKGEKK